MSLKQMMGETLSLPTNAIGFQVGQRLADLFPTLTIVESDNGLFNVEEYGRAGLCELQPDTALRNQLITYWRGPGRGLQERTRNGCFDIQWQGHSLKVVIMTWLDQMGPALHAFILTDICEVAENFLVAVCEWNMEVRGEVLVFDNGCWNKDEELFQEIQSATFDNLILQGSLKTDLRDDLTQFFAARATYERYKIPWKRGILLVGPPGNGKTHAIKALINSLQQPCLYVKSFQSQHPVDNYNIHQVFDRARKSAPCLLVLEDLDSLVTARNRSFFLNELDGFATNIGIVTLATTNHPERLDPAIVDRPSRFDRKYHFDLPAPPERLAYIRLWNESLETELRLDDAGIAQVAEATAEFSFAYLKELFLSSMMRWINLPDPKPAGGVASLMLGQVETLREQMVSANTQPSAPEGEPMPAPPPPPWRVGRLTSSFSTGIVFRDGFGPTF